MEKPHWRVDETKLRGLLDIAHSFPSVSSSYTILHQDGDFLRFVNTNREYYLESKLELLNEDNRPESSDPVLFNRAQLRYLVARYKNFTLAFTQGRLFLMAEGVQVKIDTYQSTTPMAYQSLPKALQTSTIFPQVVLDGAHFAFGHASNINETRLLVAKNRVYIPFLKFNGYFETQAENLDYGSFYLRKTDVPVLSAFHKFSGGSGLVGFHKETRRLWLLHEDTLVSVQSVAAKGATPAEDFEQSKAKTQPLELILPRLADTLETMAFLKVPNVHFVSKGGEIRARCPQVDSVVGNGSAEDFTSSVATLASFVKFAKPTNDQSPVETRTGNGVLYFGFSRKGMVANLFLKNDLSAKKQAQPIHAESTRVVAPASHRQEAGSALASLALAGAEETSD